MKKTMAILMAITLSVLTTACSEGAVSESTEKRGANESSFNDDNAVSGNDEIPKITTSGTENQNEEAVSEKTVDNNTDSSSRTQKNGFDENTAQNVISGNYIIPVPDYWIEDTPNDEDMDYRGYAETDGKTAMLMIMSMVDTIDPATFDVLYEDKDNMVTVLTAALSNIGSPEFIGSDIYETEELKGMTFDYSFTAGKYGIGGNAEYIVFPSEKDNKWIYISIIVTENTDHLYDDDFAKMLSAIKKNDETDSEENPSSLLKGIRPEFKEAMDSYEAFFDEYCDFMNKYSENPADLSLLTEYLEYIEKYPDVMDKMNKLGEEEMSDEELLYYSQTMLRIEQKLLDAIN